MTPSEAFVEVLAAQGVTHVFGIVGSAYMDALDLFPAAGIRFVPTVHEQGAGHMADGFARVSGRHGVCIAQNGPGVTNFVTAIAAAYWAHSPVVAVTPEAGSLTMGLGGFQETEQLAIFSKITKYQAHVTHPARMAELTARAFDRAHLELGPTQLNVPRDHFYGEVECEIPQPLRVARGPGASADLDAAARLLADARFPVIIAGGGVVMSEGVGACVALAELLGAPVVNSYLHNDSFPASHPLACGPLGYHGSKAAMRTLAKADVVLALGSRLGPFGTLPQYGIDYWPADAKLVQVDADPRVLGLVKKATVAVCGDAREAAEALRARLSSRPLAGSATRAERERAVASEREAWEAERRGWDHETDGWSLEAMSGASELHPRQVLRELERALPEGAMVSTDIGNVCQIANSYLRFERPRSMFGAMMFGNCGYAFPAVIGCKAAAPERSAVAYVGDGAWGMSFGELLTCVREQLPVTAVVFNNRQWGAEKKNQVDFYANRFVGVELENPSWAGVARAQGAHRVNRREIRDEGPALRDACAAQAEGRTTVIEILLTRELGDPFRRDALKLPKRLLPKYRAYSADE
jgi:sulfoacetaldehyde acetyltransferase